jgi:hypothetical protein
MCLRAVQFAMETTLQTIHVCSAILAKTTCTETVWVLNRHQSEGSKEAIKTPLSGLATSARYARLPRSKWRSTALAEFQVG